MATWQDEVKALEDELKQLDIKLDHPHNTKSAEADYDIKSKIIDLQNQIIEIYIRETNNLLKKITNHTPHNN